MGQVAGLSTQYSQPLGAAADQAMASLTVLGEAPDSEPAVPCRIESIAGTCMQVRLAQSVAPDLPLRVEALDSLWLGTAEACVGVPGDYLLTLYLSHHLRNLPELARLSERFRGRAPRVEPAGEAIDWNA